VSVRSNVLSILSILLKTHGQELWMKKPQTMLLAFVVAIVGCAGGRGEPIRYPGWALGGAPLAKEGEVRCCYGAGAQRLGADGDSQRARRAAEQGAIAAVAGAFQAYFSRRLGSYTSWAERSDGEGEATDISSDIQVFVTYDAVREAFVSARIVDRWEHPATGDWLALARIDLAAFLAAADASRDLEPEAKAFFADHAERVHDLMREGPGVTEEELEAPE
jgi:hypothetical protein